mgnify:CR=1 FL=1
MLPRLTCDSNLTRIIIGKKNTTITDWKMRFRINRPKDTEATSALSTLIPYTRSKERTNRGSNTFIATQTMIKSARVAFDISLSKRNHLRSAHCT